MRANKRLGGVVGVTWAIIVCGVVYATAADKLSKEASLLLGRPAPATPAKSNVEAASKDLPAATAQAGTASASPVAAGALSPAALAGRELFTHKWTENDPRAHGGDGLGPAYNETSCAACHDQGGLGGGGNNSHNVDVLTARVALGQKSALSAAAQEAELAAVHPDFLHANEFVLHANGIGTEYSVFRHCLLATELTAQTARALVVGTARPGGTPPNLARDPFLREMMLKSGIKSVTGPTTIRTRDDGLSVVLSQRNTTSLFGVGLIDTISDEILLREEYRQRSDDPKIAGRAARLPGGKIGRFGWKSQAATLAEFTSTACANEVGLTVPGKPQAVLPTSFRSAEPKLDMTAQEVGQLVAFLKNLPVPVERAAVTPEEGNDLAVGRAHLAAVGCTFCHTPSLGNVSGISSDLLLHDITPDVSVPYYGSEFQSPGLSASAIDLADIGKAAAIKQLWTRNWSEATSNVLLPEGKLPEKHQGSLGPEWRTPPLWGVADSAPYLHDGQAATLEQAIALHGGQAQKSAIAFFKLKKDEQRQVLAFLKSLSAPPQAPDQVAAR